MHCLSQTWSLVYCIISSDCLCIFYLCAVWTLFWPLSSLVLWITVQLCVVVYFCKDVTNDEGCTKTHFCQFSQVYIGKMNNMVLLYGIIAIVCHHSALVDCCIAPWVTVMYTGMSVVSAWWHFRVVRDLSCEVKYLVQLWEWPSWTVDTVSSVMS